MISMIVYKGETKHYRLSVVSDEEGPDKAAPVSLTGCAIDVIIETYAGAEVIAKHLAAGETTHDGIVILPQGTDDPTLGMADWTLASADTLGPPDVGPAPGNYRLHVRVVFPDGSVKYPIKPTEFQLLAI